MILYSEWKIQRRHYLLTKGLAGFRVAAAMAICYIAYFLTLLCLSVALVSLLATIVFTGFLFLFLYGCLFCLAFAYISFYLYEQAQSAKSDYCRVAYVPPYSLETVPAEQLLIPSIEDPVMLRETLLRSHAFLSQDTPEQLLRYPTSE